MALPPDRINLWGKRPAADPLPDAPQARSRRRDAPASMSAPSMAVPLPVVSRFDVLPEEVRQYFLQWVDRASQGMLSRCSTAWANRVNMVRHDQDGALVANGQLRRGDSHETFFRILQARLCGPDCMEVSRPADDSAISTSLLRQRGRPDDREIGYRLGCSRGHLAVDYVATPELLAGLAQATRWRSLTLGVARSGQDLPALLTSLADGLRSQATPWRRELALTIEGGGAQPPAMFPDKVWDAAVELVSLRLDGLPYPAAICAELVDVTALRRFSAAIDSGDSVAGVLRTIGAYWPALECVELYSCQGHWMQDDSWRQFIAAHTPLQILSLNFANATPQTFRFHVQGLAVRRFDLSMRDFSDPDGALATWVRESRTLDEFCLCIDLDMHDHRQDLYRLAQAIGASRSLRKFCLMHDSRKGGSMWSPAEIQNSLCTLGILLEAICNNVTLAELRLPINLQTIVDAEGLQQSCILRHLDTLETMNPGLTLTIGDLSFGPGMSRISPVYQVQAEEFIERYGDMSVSQAPEDSGCVDYTVSLPTWGQGAFRIMISQMLMDYDDACDYIWEQLGKGRFTCEKLRL